MEFSNRDETQILRSQSGQAVVEYILILVVVVGLILGGVYQFNDAFKVWANNYFGDYLTCLLETGELPIIDAAPGDSGICNQLFKTFSLADGRPLGTKPGDGGGGGSESGKSKSSDAGGAKEGAYSGGGGSGSGSSGSNSKMSSHFGGQSSAGSVVQKNGKGGDKDSYTGSTAAGSYGSPGGGGGGSKGNPQVRQRIDNRFAFEEEKEERQKAKSSSTSRATASEAQAKSRIKMHARELKKNTLEQDKPFTFGNFLRFIIMAAIIIALVVFIGGQMLQVGKSME